MKKLLASSLFAFALAGATPLFAQPQAGDWEFTLGGSGNSDQDFDRGGFGLNVGAGYFFNPNLELGLRQNVTYNGNQRDDEWSGSTRGAVDWHFQLGKFVPFVGANFGLDYNEDNDRWGIGPEVGMKYYVYDRTFLMAMGEYRWYFDRFRDLDNNADDGSFVFTVGIGFNVGKRH
jgi:hypothetical protein